MFKGFSFYSEPIEEAEVQRQIKEYLKMKHQLKKNHQQRIPLGNKKVDDMK